MLVQTQASTKVYKDFDIIFGPSLRDIWALYHPTRAVYCALLDYYAYWMLIGACDPML